MQTMITPIPAINLKKAKRAAVVKISKVAMKVVVGAVATLTAMRAAVTAVAVSVARREKTSILRVNLSMIRSMIISKHRTSQSSGRCL